MTSRSIARPTPIRVLVFPCGSEIGLELHRALAWARPVELWGATSTSDSHGRFVYRRCVQDLPWINDPELIPALQKLVQREQIDLLYPAHDDAVVLFAEHAADFDCGVVGSIGTTARLCRSKRRTYNALSDVVRVPAVYQHVEDIPQFPVFLKPDEGQGSRGTYTADTPEQVRAFASRDPSVLILEYLPGREFTIDCFTDRSGVLRFVGGRERIRVQNGISVHTAPVDDVRLSDMANVINSRLRLRGGWFFQVKEDAGGELVLLEVSARIAGSMAVHRVRGTNLPLLSVYDALEMDVDVTPQHWSIELDRALINRYHVSFAYEHVYIDLDDCIIHNGSVEPLVAAFLVQCAARDIGLHLVTRHAGQLEHTLRRHRLDRLFDEVIHCAPEEAKSEYVKQPSAIFIDDSFRERAEVASVRGIPVFDLDAIECLIDWRR